GRWLATGSRDNTARLWSVDNPAAEPVVLRGHEFSVGAVAFSPDGRWLATGSEDNTARLWNMRLDELMELACNLAGRNLTRAEWRQYFPGEEYRKTCEQWLEGE
ncbi:MAG: WD40 repeat domain-containing protein, partial [Anaerolineae bacterium]